VQADGHRVHQSPDGTLLIHNLRARDEGAYTCSAYRGSQAVSRSTKVKVAPPGMNTCLLGWWAHSPEHLLILQGWLWVPPGQILASGSIAWGKGLTSPEPRFPPWCSGLPHH
jgi:hypothetical protein